jgi:hypothetical protein
MKNTKQPKQARPSKRNGGSRCVRRIVGLRTPNTVWYGPYPCPDCGLVIVKTGNGAKPLVLDAADHDHHYPNFQWRRHVCWKPNSRTTPTAGA